VSIVYLIDVSDGVRSYIVCVLMLWLVFVIKSKVYYVIYILHVMQCMHVLSDDGSSSVTAIIDSFDITF